MKKLIFSLLILSSVTVMAQPNFKWEKVDSVKKSKDQLYSDIKQYIALNWKSANNVIQNEDKDAGIITVKGTIEMQESLMMSTYSYTYQYIVIFRVKDNKFKVTIDDVTCISAYQNGKPNITKIQPFEGDNCPETGTLSHPGIPQGRAKKMMEKLKLSLQSIFDQSIADIKKESSNEF